MLLLSLILTALIGISTVGDALSALESLVIGTVPISLSRRDMFCPLLVPEMFRYITADDVDLRDITVKIVCLMYTNVSSLSMESHVSELEAILRERESLVIPFDITSEQDDYEKSLIKSLREKLELLKR